MTEHDGLERRGLLGVLGGGVAVGLAGCLGGDEDDGSQAQVYEPTMEGVEEGPVEFGDDDSCAVCNMSVQNYFGGRGQLVHENGLGATFESPGCLFAYVASSTPDSPIAGAWTIDRRTGDLIDATEAHFVLVTDEEAADDPMGIDPRPYADREDAVAFLEEWDAEELTPEDDIIVGLDEVDLETASIYRGSRLPDE